MSDAEKKYMKSLNGYLVMDEEGRKRAAENGAYVLQEGETLDDVPEEYSLAYDPYDESEGDSDEVTRAEFEEVKEAIADKAESSSVPNAATVDGSTLKMQRKTTAEDGTETTSELFEVELPTDGGTGTVTSVNGVSPDENGNVTVEVGQPTDEQITSAVETWLDEHPEATTTVADGSITTPKFAAAEVAKNQLVDPDDFKTNGVTGYIDQTTGAVSGGGAAITEDYSGYMTSPFYRVEAGKTYVQNIDPYGEKVYGYDENKNFTEAIATQGSTDPFTIPDGTVYIRWCKKFDITAGLLETWMICEGDVLYDDYFIGKQYVLNGSKLDMKEKSFPGSAIIPQSIGYGSLIGTTILQQIFDGVAFWENNAVGYINRTTGSVTGSGTIPGTVDDTYKTSDYLACKANTLYSMNFDVYNAVVYFYEANKTYIGNVAVENRQFTTPENAAYVRFTTTTNGNAIWNDTTATTHLMICEGERVFTGFVKCGDAVIIRGFLLDMSTPENSVDGSVLADGSVPMAKIKPDTALKILCLGDSLTQDKYPSILATILKADVTDAGIGGNTINQINSRVGNYGTDFDIVTLMCGTNDNGGQTSCPLGTIDDEAATDDNATATDTTYVSRLKRLLNTIKSTHPGVMYILMPMFEHAWGEHEEVANMMESVAKLYRIPYLDIFHECGWSGKNEADKALYMSDDTHENDLGAQRIAGMLAGRIRELTGM